MKALKIVLFAGIVVLISVRSLGQATTVKDDLTKAQSLFKEGKADEATRIYLDLMGKYPKNREAVQGWLIANMKRTPTGEQDAIRQLDELEKTFPDNTGILFYKTFIMAEYKQMDAALKNTEKLVSLEPDDGINWLMRGQLLEAAERNDEALPAYQKATVLAPGNADAWQNLAGLLAKNEKFDDAIAAFSKAIELAPGQPVFIYNRGCCYCRKGDKVNALADLGKAVSMNPQFKSYAPTDADYKSLWDDPDFKKIITQ